MPTRGRWFLTECMPTDLQAVKCSSTGRGSLRQIPQRASTILPTGVVLKRSRAHLESLGRFAISQVREPVMKRRSPDALTADPRLAPRQQMLKIAFAKVPRWQTTELRRAQKAPKVLHEIPLSCSKQSEEKSQAAQKDRGNDRGSFRIDAKIVEFCPKSANFVQRQGNNRDICGFPSKPPLTNCLAAFSPGFQKSNRERAGIPLPSRRPDLATIR